MARQLTADAPARWLRGGTLVRTNSLATPEELAFGQTVIITARWILVLSGLLFVAWNPGSLSVLRLQFAVLFGLAGVNFYLQAQLLRDRRIRPELAHAVSAADLAVITLVVWSQGGFASGSYVFYFPAILALSGCFPATVTLVLTGGAMAGYAVVCGATEQPEILLTRLMMLAAVAACGHTYRWIEHARHTAGISREHDARKEQSHGRLQEHDA